jgi:multiple sugar transport system permease protein
MTASRRLPAVLGRALVLAIALAVTLLPLLSLVFNSLKLPVDFFGANFLPQHWTLRNYAGILGGGDAISDLLHSLIVTVSTTVLCVGLGTLAAFGLARLRYSWIGVVTLAILVVRFYPKITTIIPYFVMMRSFGLLDTTVAVIIAHVSITLPFVVLLMITFFRDLPTDIEEAAALDGCSIFQNFRHIALPLAVPGIATAAILTAMTSWNEFLIAASVTGPHSATLPVLISSFISDKGIDLGHMSAVTVLVVLPIAAFMLVTQRYLVRGLTMGAVKG